MDHLNQAAFCAADRFLIEKSCKDTITVIKPTGNELQRATSHI